MVWVGSSMEFIAGFFLGKEIVYALVAGQILLVFLAQHLL
jgi:hypothetical protein